MYTYATISLEARPMKLILLIKENKKIMNRPLLSQQSASLMSNFYIRGILSWRYISVYMYVRHTSAWPFVCLAAFRDTSFLLIFLTDFSKLDMCIGPILRISIGIIYG